MIAQGEPVSQLTEQGLELWTYQCRGFLLEAFQNAQAPLSLGHTHAEVTTSVPMEFSLDLWGLKGDRGATDKFETQPLEM